MSRQARIQMYAKAVDKIQTLTGCTCLRWDAYDCLVVIPGGWRDETGDVCTCPCHKEIEALDEPVLVVADDE